MNPAFYLPGLLLALALRYWVLPRLLRRIDERWCGTPYEPDQRYTYRENMKTADTEAINRIGDARFQEVVAAQEKCKKKER